MGLLGFRSGQQKVWFWDQGFELGSFSAGIVSPSGPCRRRAVNMRIFCLDMEDLSIPREAVIPDCDKIANDMKDVHAFLNNQIRR